MERKIKKHKLNNQNKMELKITSSHKTLGNIPVSDFFVNIEEFTIGVKRNTISLRTNVYTKDDDGAEYLFSLMETDPLHACLHQDLTVLEYAQKTATRTLTGTEYEIEAQLLFGLIFGKIAEVNAITPDAITYSLIGF